MCHNASAVLMSNGRTIVAIQEERITKKKITGYPKSNSVCIKQAKKKIIIEKLLLVLLKIHLFYKVPLNLFHEEYDDFYGEKFYEKGQRYIYEKYISRLLKDKRNSLDLYLDFKVTKKTYLITLTIQVTQTNIKKAIKFKLHK